MKKYLILFLLFPLHFSVRAQDSDSLKLSAKWQFGLNFSSDLCFRELYDQNGANQGIISYRDLWEEPKFGFTAGVNTLYSLGRHISIGVGLQYSNKGFKMEMEQLNFETPYSQPSVVNYKTRYNLHYIDVPMGLNFSFGNADLRFVGSAGVAVNVFLTERDKSTFVFPDREEKSVSVPQADFNRLNLTPFLSSGLSYMLNPTTTLRIEPTVRYGIFKTVNAPISERLFSAGLNVAYYKVF